MTSSGESFDGSAPPARSGRDAGTATATAGSGAAKDGSAHKKADKLGKAVGAAALASAVSLDRKADPPPAQQALLDPVKHPSQLLWGSLLAALVAALGLTVAYHFRGVVRTRIW